nr:uncharacterized protein LOC109977258 isoform X2 [Labrus bergylta]
MNGVTLFFLLVFAVGRAQCCLVTASPGFPPINSVCKHDGRAFVSTYTDGSCEFEGEGHLASDKCQDNNTICAFGRVSSATENNEQISSSDNTGLIVGPSIAAAVVLVIGLALYFKMNICKKKRQEMSNIGMQPGKNDNTETSERESLRGPGLADDDTSSSPRSL